jgi:hypothetical protein
MKTTEECELLYSGRRRCFMANREILNLGQTSVGKDQESPTAGDNARDLVDQTRFDVSRMRRQLERQQDEYESQSRRTKVLAMILGVLIVTFAAAVWLAYPTWKNQNIALADMPGVQNLANTFRERMSSVEVNLDKVSAGLPALADRFDQLQADMKGSMQTARNQAQTIATQAAQRIREDVSRSMQVIQSRLAGLESNQRESSERVNLLQQQITRLQQELAAMRESASAATERIERLNVAHQTSSQQLMGLNTRMDANKDELDTLTSQLDRKRIDFEVPNRRYTEIGPNIYLIVGRTDMGKQEVDGTLRLGTVAAKRLAIREQAIQEPIIFYIEDERRPAELVLTKVSKAGVSGYLIMPAPLKTGTP